LIAQLKDNAKELLEIFREKIDFAVGNSEVMEFVQPLVDKHSIYRHGRATIFEGSMEYFGCPVNIDRKAKWDINVPNSIDLVANYALGKKADFSKPLPLPDPIPLKKSKGSKLHLYEKALFTKITAIHGPITMVNPSKSAIWSACHLKYHIYFSDETIDTKDYRLGIREEVKRSGHEFSEVYNLDGICYLGSNGPQNEMPGRWFSLSPNPWVASFPFDIYEIQDGSLGIILKYYKNNKLRTCNILRYPDYGRYSPSDLDLHCGISGEVSFFLETNFYTIPCSLDNDAGPIAGYVPQFPPYNDVKLGDKTFRVSYDNNFLYDIVGYGTYMSRRHKLIEFQSLLGLNLVPITKVGPCEITWFGFTSRDCGGIRKMYDRDGVSCFILDDDNGKMTLTNRALGNFDSYYVYSASLVHGNNLTIFPKGGYVEVNADSSFIYSIPTTPGVYFFSKTIDLFYVRQMEILAFTYGCSFIPQHGAVNLFDYPYYNHESSVRVILDALPDVGTWQDGGISEIEIATKAHLNLQGVLTTLLNMKDVVVHSVGGVRKWKFINSVKNTFSSFNGFRTLTEIMIFFSTHYFIQLTFLQDIINVMNFFICSRCCYT